MSNWGERLSCADSSLSFICAMSAPSRSPVRRRWPPRGSVLQPGLLEVTQHQAAHSTEGVWIGRVQRRISPQHAPALAAQNLFQIVHVAVDGLDVGIAAIEQDFQVV